MARTANPRLVRGKQAMASVIYEPLPKYLADIQGQMEEYARGHGLDFFPTIFELVDCDQLNEVAAYGGFPDRKSVV